MGDSLFDIFGDHLMRQAVKNVGRQPLSNNENVGKTVLNAPIKPNEPMKKGDTKKSFLSNTGKALQSTPARQVFTPRAVNVGALIYSDPDADVKEFNMEELEFTKPSYKYDNYHTDIHDYLNLPTPKLMPELSPPNTPPPTLGRHSMELDNSYHDEFFTDDFSNESIQDEDLGLPDLY
ncbi:uncharacterized protein LOC114360287 [Ostrinia furnacalis]|uniref:uncharacterized protein LOC114360287 n=1 Tax=Ostrinia furnacalis TaxID=93504 RepID=UPI00103D2AEB|nr:uncharacterized protein LOC114360287 [Ostrinia furnacalis]